MNFDRVAAPYRWLETAVFGQQLQQARIAFVREIAAPRRVLVVGEGNGRFLAAFLQAFPDAAVTCIEASARMIALTRRRVGKALVDFVEEDIREVALPPAHYDLIVTHFVLDCFNEATLSEVVAKLAHAAKPEASWLLADFREPPDGWEQRHARFWLRSMYAFFRLTTGIDADQLVDPSPFFREAGFGCHVQRLYRFEMIKSEWWRRSA